MRIQGLTIKKFELSYEGEISLEAVLTRLDYHTLLFKDFNKSLNPLLLAIDSHANADDWLEGMGFA